jgi:hypothetical protein
VDGNVEPEVDERLSRDFEETDREYAEMADSQMLREAGEAFIQRFSEPGGTKNRAELLS